MICESDEWNRSEVVHTERERAFSFRSETGID